MRVCCRSAYLAWDWLEDIAMHKFGRNLLSLV
jgi:hypothetical protein